MEQFWQFLVITDLKATERPKNTGSIRTYLTSVREVKIQSYANVDETTFERKNILNDFPLIFIREKLSKTPRRRRAGPKGRRGGDVGSF